MFIKYISFDFCLHYSTQFYVRQFIVKNDYNIVKIDNQNLVVAPLI